MQSPHALFDQAVALQRAKRFDEAVDCYRRLLAAWPDFPVAWYNLGHLQRTQRQYRDALASYGEALRLGIERPEEVHLNRAVIYADHLRREEDAQHELRRALMLNSRFVPAILNLASLQEDLGQKEEARTLYACALAVDPDCALALARLAELSAATDPGFTAKLRQAIARPGITAEDRADLGFALGSILDSRGQYDEAFSAYAAANRAGRSLSGPYDRRAHERLIDDLIRAFPLGTPCSATPSSPIFICGMFRSGSTLAEQVLAMHPQVTSGSEVDFFSTLIGTELAPFPAGVERLDERAFAGMAARYRERLSLLFPHADRITDKAPENYLAIGLIKRVFPDARIVHTTRNPMDTCLSIFFQHIDRPYAFDLEDIAHYYGQYRRLMAHWSAQYGNDILDFNYETFIADPRRAAERLLAFCGLEWNEACLEFHRAQNRVKTASVWQVRQPLYQRSAGRWRHYEKHLAPLLSALS